MSGVRNWRAIGIAMLLGIIIGFCEPLVSSMSSISLLLAVAVATMVVWPKEGWLTVCLAALVMVLLGSNLIIGVVPVIIVLLQYFLGRVIDDQIIGRLVIVLLSVILAYGVLTAAHGLIVRSQAILFFQGLSIQVLAAAVVFGFIEVCRPHQRVWQK